MPLPPSAAKRPLLLGHRGARRYAPENTLAAFELALEHGCDGFEFDIRLTADGQPLVCHDAKLFGLAVEESAFELVRARAALKGVSLCRLDDVLAQFADRAFLDIELKVPGLEETTLAALRQTPPQRGYCVSSYLPEVLERLHALDAALPLGLICEREPQLAGWRELLIQSVFLHFNLLSASVLEELHAAGKQVFVWTVNDAPDMRAFAGMGVEGIVSDDTSLLAHALAPRP
jgi:glycerophosphoryl diester phosphodiesterase